jgi:radical SAM enzyme (TIGR01210 family)
LTRQIESSDIPQLRGRMRAILRTVRGNVPLTPLSKPAGVFFVPSSWSGRPNIIPLIWIATAGCRWMPGIGCTMCNFGSAERTFTVEEIIFSVKAILSIIPSVPLIHIAPGGSFLDDREVVPELRQGILQLLGAREGLLQVGIESRPEFVSALSLSKTQEMLCGQGRPIRLVVGLGLESIDELTREVCINKGTSLDSIDQVIRLIHELDTPLSPLGVEVHVLLKPPFVSEAESVQDAIAAITWAAGKNVDRTILMLNSVKEHTLCEWLHDKLDFSEPRRFVPPRLWSALEVLLQLPSSTRERVLTFGFTNNIHIKRTAANCEACTTIIKSALYAFNYSKDPSHLYLANGIPCSCRSDWKELMTANLSPLRTRIVDDLDAIELVLRGMQNGEHRH